jgi:hypothetical protein
LKRALAPNKRFQRMASLRWAAGELRRYVVAADIAGYTNKFLTIQDAPFIAPCCLLAVPVQYRRAEPHHDALL